MMLHFPEEFPLEALSILAPIVRSGGVVGDKVLAGEAVLTLQGWAMGQYLGHEHEINVVGSAPFAFGAGVPDEYEAVAALAEMESASAVARDPRVVGAFNFRKFAENAMKVVQFVLPLLLRA